MVGAVWAAPVIIGASAVPAFAASIESLEYLVLRLDSPWFVWEGDGYGAVHYAGAMAVYDWYDEGNTALSFTYTLTLTLPNGDEVLLIADTQATLAPGAGREVVPLNGNWEHEDPETGTYTLTLTARTPSESKTVSSSAALP